MEQPGPSDVDDAAAVGAEAQPYPMARPNLQPGQERLFRSALASTIGNLIGTGKTNAEQLAHASDRTNETALTARAAEEPDVPTANRIVAAVAGKVREPYKVGPQGQLLNEETGVLDENTALAGAVKKLRDAQAAAATASAGQRDAGGKPPVGFRWTRTARSSRSRAARQTRSAASRSPRPTHRRRPATTFSPRCRKTSASRSGRSPRAARRSPSSASRAATASGSTSS
jgi:hypothetical protein